MYNIGYDLGSSSLKIALTKSESGEKVKLIHTRFYQIALGFKQMYLLSKLAERKKVSVLNGSAFSYLDCFDRVQSSSNDSYWIYIPVTNCR